MGKITHLHNKLSLRYYLKIKIFIKTLILRFAKHLNLKEITLKQLIVVETIHARPGKTTELKQALLEMVIPSLKEKGCLHYEIAEPANKEDLNILVLMRWENLKAFEAHGHSDHVQEFINEYGDTLYDGFQENLYWTC